MTRTDHHTVGNWLELAHQSHYRAVVLSKALGISPRQLRRCTQRAFGRSPQAWLDEQRLAMAAGMLRRHRSVKEVGFMLGFSQTSNFSREFKRHYGICPSAFLEWADQQPDPNGNAESAAP